MDAFFRRASIEVERVTVSYALAKATGEPLLYKGKEFAKTDFIPAK
jgi:uncharacterized protein with PIN domain